MSRVVFFIIFILAIGADVHAQSKLEQKMGTSTYAMVLRSQGIFHDEGLLNLVKEVGGKLEKELKLDYPLQYYLVDVAEPNAFATGGGYDYVTRGLLAIINTRDELAGILAHELTHVTEKHANKKLTYSAVPLVLELPGNLIGALTRKEVAHIINLPISEASKIAIKAFDRNQEKEADEKGIELAIKAGFDGYRLVDGLNHLNQFVEYELGKPSKRSIYNDHPITSTRLVYLTTILNKKGIKRKEQLAGTDISAIDGLAFGQNPDEGVARGNKFAQPQLQLYFEFPEKWEIQNSPVSVNAISVDRQSTIIISIDTSTLSPTQAAQAELNMLKGYNITEQSEIKIHELESFHATLLSTSTKSTAPTASEILWIKIPTTDILLKIVGITHGTNPTPEISTSLRSSRLLVEPDYIDFPVNRIRLKEFSSWEEIENHYSKSRDKEKILKLLKILNGIDDQTTFGNSRFIKVIETEPLRLN